MSCSKYECVVCFALAIDLLYSDFRMINVHEEVLTGISELPESLSHRHV